MNLYINQYVMIFIVVVSDVNRSLRFLEPELFSFNFAIKFTANPLMI